MFLLLLSLRRYNNSNISREIDTKLISMFPECNGRLLTKNLDQNKNLDIFKTLSNDEYLCVYGSLIIGANSSISANVFYPKLDSRLQISITNSTIVDPFVITNKIDTEDIYTAIYDINPLSKVYWSNQLQNCEIQISFIQQPYHISTEITNNGENIKIEDENVVYISSDNNFSVDENVSLEISKETIKYKTLSVFITGNNKKILKYEKNDNIFDIFTYNIIDKEANPNSILFFTSSKDINSILPAQTPIPSPVPTPIQTPFNTPFNTPYQTLSPTLDRYVRVKTFIHIEEGILTETEIIIGVRHAKRLNKAKKLENTIATRIEYHKTHPIIKEVEHLDIYYEDFVLMGNHQAKNDLKIHSEKIEELKETKNYYPNNTTIVLRTNNGAKRLVDLIDVSHPKPTSKPDVDAGVKFPYLIVFLSVFGALIIASTIAIVIVICIRRNHREKTSSDSITCNTSDAYNLSHIV